MATSKSTSGKRPDDAALWRFVFSGCWPGNLEVRQQPDGSAAVSGSFPYESTATISDRGRVRKERFARGAFAYSVSGAGSDERLDLLVGHDFDKPLASRQAGTLEVQETPDALTFEAALPADAEQPTWMRDALLAAKGGLLQGVSPGFVIPPASAVPDAVTLVPEREVRQETMVRVIRQAVLYELSLVTRPAYADSDIDVRQRLDPHIVLDEPKRRRRRVWL